MKIKMITSAWKAKEFSFSTCPNIHILLKMTKGSCVHKERVPSVSMRNCVSICLQPCSGLKPAMLMWGCCVNSKEFNARLHRLLFTVFTYVYHQFHLDSKRYWNLSPWCSCSQHVGKLSALSPWIHPNRIVHLCN